MAAVAPAQPPKLSGNKKSPSVEGLFYFVFVGASYFTVAVTMSQILP